MKVLWIAGWYPNQTEPYAGDFVQRHAQAVSLYVDLTVLFVTRDATGIVTRDLAIEEFAHGRLKERKIYYDTVSAKIPVAGRIASYLKYHSLLRKEIKKYISENGRPDLIHFYIGMRTGTLSNWINSLKIPYVVSEQWTGFLKEGQPNFTALPSLFRKGWRSLVVRAAGVHVVSEYLGNALQQLVQKELPLKLIPNVVNTDIFSLAENKTGNSLKLVFITSQLAYQKNTQDLLYALSLLKQRDYSFTLDVFGPLQQEYRELAIKLGIEKEVIIHGEKNQEELAKYFGQADALIIYSRFETFGCVIIEANSCGIPVIASDIPVLHENIREGFNGMFARSEDRAALAERLEWFAANKTSFNRQEIAKHTASVYNYEKVGKIFSDWYSQLSQATKDE